MDRLNQNYCWSFSGIKWKLAFYHSSIQEINAHPTICNKTQQSPCSLTQQQAVNVTFFGSLSLKLFYSSHICVNSISLVIILLSFPFFIIACFTLSHLSLLSSCRSSFSSWSLILYIGCFLSFYCAVRPGSLTGSCSRTEWVTGAVWQRWW